MTRVSRPWSRRLATCALVSACSAPAPEVAGTLVGGEVFAHDGQGGASDVTSTDLREDTSTTDLGALLDAEVDVAMVDAFWDAPELPAVEDVIDAPDAVPDVFDVAGDDVPPPGDVLEDLPAPIDAPIPVIDTLEGSAVVGLGRLVGVAPSQAFEALSPGQDLEIVLGPQGGYHLELAAELDAPAQTVPKLLVTIACSAQHVHEEIGSVYLDKHVCYRGADGLYRTQVLPVFFLSPTAASYAGESVLVGCTITGAETGGASLMVTLVDEL